MSPQQSTKCSPVRKHLILGYDLKLSSMTDPILHGMLKIIYLRRIL